ncbi:lymphocyte transmembrane adapter 1 isoform X1 [Neofelis nebulosa]|uniref:lymphocyte transmembrane adapter 1 isoform X1 n=2 Tax=Neofelis nebulosa TaxID=61452 RepID=UPI00272C2D7E|nr:lymphocyte transmembrane adapter 1 isoform X1 [Neofelis nebulosa]XP_058556501.1 lymphocyte transmembrane adapter 1 isoform X1 [Neofelis nebulosa]XP_058556502.1 lymphocyte transmembrane adapter 1 isoform X1 [Neofelis nebulosa]XP_058556503.1 lymphocyte transmembrane adapter 1 isoform X1 [Neofelis nebulosa]XP_058556505.1 lymphocyte transmembrane adapter 1 isoform X1 [Neofelis nebulosa]XP_058556506.1 lymphocyte transmembrane adapter 1 isoform X1 [Neofelis nebulosa]
MAMDMITPTLSEIRGGTSEARTLQETGGSLDRHKDHSRAIFSGFAGFLAILLTAMIFYGLWNWNKLKKRQVPYFRVTVMPLLTLSRPRQGAKNIYDSLPQRQEDLGRRQSRSNRIFSTESLLSRHSETPPSEHVPSPAGNVLWVHRDHYPANGYAVGIYDNATGLQMRGDLTPSAHYVNVTAARDCLSISSEDSRDYINVPTAEQIAETLLASANATPTNSFAPPNAQKLELTEEREQGCGNASDHTSVWSPRSESDDPLSDEESSSETSNDYVNMAGLNLEAIHGKQPWMVSQCYRDYENVPSAHASGSQQQAEEEVTSSNTDHVEGRTDGPGTHAQFVMQSGRFLALGDYVTSPPSAQKETSQVKHGEEMPNEASDDYENVLAANFGDVDPKGPDA